MQFVAFVLVVSLGLACLIAAIAIRYGYEARDKQSESREDIDAQIYLYDDNDYH